jgi:hypothetical protein
MAKAPSGGMGRRNLRTYEPGIHRFAGWLLPTLSVLLMTIPAMAATDGQMGSISSGSIGLSIRRTNVVVVNGLTDIALAAWGAGSTAPSGFTGVCVFSSLGSFAITASSAHARGSDFRLSNGIDSIAYSVRWRDGAGESPLSSGVPLSNLRGDASSQDCSGTVPAQLAVHVSAQELQTADKGSYADTLTIVVAPE